MRIAIVGLGYVGIPLSLQFARSGVTVLGLDVDLLKVKALNEGRSYNQEFPSGDVRHSEADISKAGRLLNYEPSHTLGEGLTEALAWYRQHLG